MRSLLPHTESMMIYEGPLELIEGNDTQPLDIVNG
jgi:hypothetical protein